MDYKLRENIRLNKVCSTCEYGSCLSSNESVELCLKDMGCDDDSSPILAPRIKTCLEYKSEEN